ncbi:LacI family transcriptional regulator [Rhodococcus qingshengii]|jgi:DNA-binding LacI/PurR family transcriptional regulator|nr:LacI family transcriptional regulator [Rhodococcus qingshengii]
MVKLKDIAEYVGVSISTVSRVIQSDPTRNVNSETKRKVWDAVKELGYTPNQNARNLVTNNQQKSRKRTMKIGWVADYKIIEMYPYYASMLNGVSDYLDHSEYTLVNINKEVLQHDPLLHKTIHESGIEGLILFDIIDESIMEYASEFIPIVGLDFSYSNKNMNISVVDFDREEAGVMAVNHLIQKGHKKIGFLGGGIGGQFENLQEESRYKGYHKAMKAAGLIIQPEWTGNTKWSMENSYAFMAKLLEECSDHLPTAMFCASDMMAIAAMRAVFEHNLRIPEDIAFIGLDNIEMSKYSSPPLSTIDIPKYEMGELAAKTIIDRIEGKIRLPIKIHVPFELVIRESSKICRKI